MRLTFIVVTMLAMSLPVSAAPTPATVRAFQRYVADAESRIRVEESAANPSKISQGAALAFLRIESMAPAERQEAETRLRRGEVLVEKVSGGSKDVPGGMIHDWVGTAFIPDAKVAQVLALVQDYDDLARYYQPDVQASRLISRNGEDFHVYMRLRKHKVVTVLLDTEYEVHYGHTDPQHWFSESRSTRIAETDGSDHGFLWRLNSYWRFVQADDGVIVQCEAISLTRDIPIGLGWMVGPFVTKIPRESLEFTMMATRKAVAECSVVTAQCSTKAGSFRSKH